MYVESKMRQNPEVQDLFAPENAFQFKVLKRAGMMELYGEVERRLDKYEMAGHIIQLWEISQRNNFTYRPIRMISRSKSKTVDDYCNDDTIMRVFVQDMGVAQKDEGVKEEISSGPSEEKEGDETAPEKKEGGDPPKKKVGLDQLVFLRRYVPGTMELPYVGAKVVTTQDLLFTLAQAAAKASGMDEEAKLALYDMVKPGTCKRLNLEDTLEKGKIRTGDVIAVQIVAPEGAALKLPDVPAMLNYLENRTSVMFRTLAEPTKDVARVELLRTDKYPEITEKLGQAVGVDAKHIRLTGYNETQETPKKKAYKQADGYTLERMLAYKYNGEEGRSDVLLYEVLDDTLEHIESQRQLKVSLFSYETNSLSDTYELPVPKDGTVGDLIGRAMSLHPPQGSGVYRVLETSGHMIEKVYKPTDSIGFITDSAHLRIEEVPAFEVKAMNEKEEHALVSVVFYELGYQRYSYGSPVFYGDPLLVPIKKGKALKSFKRVLEKYLHLEDGEIENYTFATVSGGQRVRPIADFDIIDITKPVGLSASLTSNAKKMKEAATTTATATHTATSQTARKDRGITIKN